MMAVMTAGTRVLRVYPLGGRTAWRVCLLAGLFFFYQFFQLNSFDVLNAMLSAHFSLSVSGVSSLSSAFLFANLFTLLPAGWLVDHYPVRYVMIGALSLSLLGVMCFVLGGSLWVLWLGRFLTGAANSVCFLSCVLLVSRWFPQQKQGLLMGLMVTLAFLGGMLAHAPFAVLVAHIGWQHALEIDFGMGVLLLALLWFGLCDRPAPESQTIHRRSFKKVWGCVSIYLAGLYTSFLNLPLMILGALWGARYLEMAYHVSAIRAIEIVSLLFLGSLVGCPILGALSDWLKRRKIVMWGGWIGTVGCFAMLLSGQVSTDWQLAVLFLSLGFFTSAQVISYPLIAESVQSEFVGEATAIASLLVVGGAALGQMLFGWLLERAGSGQSLSQFQSAMHLFGVALALAGVVLWFLREPKCQSQPIVESNHGS